MITRMTEIEGRLTTLELVDREFKKRARTKIMPPAEDEEPKDIKGSVLVPV